MSKIVRQRAIYLAVVCIVIGSAVTAFAVPPEQVLKDKTIINLDQPCCISFNETIAVTEPAKPVAVVVTWEVHVFEPTGEVFGLMLNGGPCAFYGAGEISNRGDSSPRTFQWVIFPTDGLRPGSNTLTLCGGGLFGDFGQIFSMTLAARLSN